MERGAEETDNQPDVLTVLGADHESLCEGFGRLRRTYGVRARRELFEELARALARHETAEAAAIYPVLARLGDEGRRIREAMLKEERIGDALLARALRTSLLRPGSRHLRQLLDEIADGVERHAGHEEQLVFPLLRRTQDRAKLEMMAGWVVNAKGLAPVRPHPHAPRNLAGLLAVGPLVALLDRMRDAGRRLLER